MSGTQANGLNPMVASDHTKDGNRTNQQATDLPVADNITLTTSQGTLHQPLWNLGWLLIASLELGQDPIDEIPVTIE